jgi:hypothetical protein
LPPEVTQLKTLQTLALDKNKFTLFPLEIIFLTGLQDLSLADNQLTWIPPEIGRLRNLRHLNLSKNRLTQIPIEIRQLSDLSTLWLESNLLGQVPAEIAYLTRLVLLDLRNNCLTSLPTQIGEMRWLQVAAEGYARLGTDGLLVEGNPLPHPYPELIAAGRPEATRNVLAWLRGELDLGSLPPPSHVDDTDLPTALPPPSRYLHVEVGPEGQIDFVPPEALDADGNNLPQLRRLHPGLRDLARELLGSMPRENTQHPILQRRCEAYLALIDQSLEEVDFNRLYFEGIRLDRARQRDSELVATRELAPLPADAAEALDSLLDAHGAFIMATAVGAAALPDQAEYEATPAERRLQRDEARAATRAILDEDGIRISPRLRDAAEAAAEGIEQGSNPIRSGAAGATLLRSLTAAVIGSAACGAPALVGYIALGPGGTILGGAAALPVFKALENTSVFKTARGYITERIEHVTEVQAGRLLDAFRKANEAVIRIEPVLRRMSHRQGFGFIGPWLDRMKPPPKDDA